MSRVLILLILCSFISIRCSISDRTEETANNESNSKMAEVDSLTLRFHLFRDAVLHSQTGEFDKLLDSKLSSELNNKARKSRFSTSLQYFKWQNPNLPALDTLLFYDLKESGEYRRLTYRGNILSFANNSDRVRYTYLLYRLDQNDWRLSGLASVDQDRYDLYGRELTIHETDLPSSMRFPKVL